MYDVVIIGAGVTGSAIARELSRYERKIAVLERASDVCEGTSKANSGIVHAGFDAKTGSLKAKLNVEGSRKMEALSKELDFAYKNNGSLVLCFDRQDIPKLEELKSQGEANGVEGLSILQREELLKLEPNLGSEVVAGLYAPTGGIVCPFGLTIALAENACENGVEFHLNTQVTDIGKKEKGYLLTTNKGQFEAAVVINAAGVYADELLQMVSRMEMKIIPRKGEYLLLDKTTGTFAQHTIFQLPTKYGKGILVSPTVHGNLLLGPTAVDLEDKEGVFTTAAGMKEIIKIASLSAEKIPAGKVITSFAGLRAHEEKGDFIIGEAGDAPGFLNVAGIESPGLTCAPAIGSYVAELVNRIKPAKLREDFIARRKGIPNMADAPEEVRKKLIEENTAYANIICRCELVTEGEILAAIHRPLGATTLDGVKRRTRAGMGRCQSGFCSPKVVEILARELGKDMSDITKAGEGSELLTGWNKGGVEDE